MSHNQQPIISAIVAMAENRVIGNQNRLPWHLPADLKHFKALTTGHPILMGRKTYESIGEPLPNRTNIIITHNKNFQAPGCIVVDSIQQAIEYAVKENNKEIFIIGGAEVYKQLLPHIQRIYLTVIHQSFEGDAYFPAINAKEWNETERLNVAADEKNPYDYSFVKLERV